MTNGFEEDFKKNCTEFWEGYQLAQPYFSDEKLHETLPSDWEKVYGYLAPTEPGVILKVAREAMERWAHLSNESPPTWGGVSDLAKGQIERIHKGVTGLQRNLDVLGPEAENKINISLGVVNVVDNDGSVQVQDVESLLNYLKHLRGALQEWSPKQPRGNQKNIDMHVALGHLMCIWRWAKGADASFGKGFNRFAEQALSSGLYISKFNSPKTVRNIELDMKLNPEKYSLGYLPPKKPRPKS